MSGVRFREIGEIRVIRVIRVPFPSSSKLA
jgi:hypothetical protein